MFVYKKIEILFLIYVKHTKPIIKYKIVKMTDCPICMEHIVPTKNCVTTECGHCFHTNCLMQNVAHNGFGCPYCRTKMADEPDEEISLYSDEQESEMFDDDALRGFRFFFNNINGEDHEQEDIAQEEEEEAFRDSDNEEDEGNENVPSTDFVAEKLREQGVTFEQLVKILCLDHAEYDDDERSENLSNELFGKIRVIVSNYSPQQQAQEQPVTTSTTTTTQPELDTDFAAQPKNVTVRRRIHQE